MAGGTGEDEIIGKIEEKLVSAPDSPLCTEILKYLSKHQHGDGFRLDDMAERLGRTEGYIIENLRHLRLVNLLNKQFFMTDDAEKYVKIISNSSD
jgi:hypothetical protein